MSSAQPKRRGLERAGSLRVRSLRCLLWGLIAALPLASAHAQEVARVPTSASLPLQAREVALSAQEKRDLDARFHKVLQRKLGLLKALDTLDRRVVEINRRVERLRLRRLTAAVATRHAETRRADAWRRLRQMRRAVRARLKTLIRLSASSSLRFVFARDEFADTVVLDRVLRKLVQGDRSRLARYRAQLAHVQDVTRTRNEALAELDRLDAEIHCKVRDLERQRGDKQRLITQIEADPAYHASARRDLDLAHEALLTKINTLERWRQEEHSFVEAKGSLSPPMVAYRVEQPFGRHRDPRFGTITLHRGVDLRPLGPGVSAVRVVFWGRVAFVGRQTGYGQMVIVDHGEGWHTVYAHLNNVIAEVGEILRPGARLGDVGSTGSLKGRYLYFEIREGGESRDPLQWLQ